MPDFPSDLLDRSPAGGALEVLRLLLRQVTEARRRLDAPDDADALHDFRVGLRRLRSCLRAYRPYVRGVVPRKVRRRLGAMAADTGAVRDAEVQLAWVKARAADAGRGERAGATWFAGQIAERQSALADAVRDGARRFDHMERSLRERLRAVPPREAAWNGAGGPGTFGAATGALVLQHAAELGARLAAVASVGDEEEAHLARIRAKRLRYLLEPLEHLRPDVPAVVQRMKLLQDLLGELHDMHVLAAEVAATLERVAVDSVRALRTQVSEGSTPGRRPRRRVQPGLLALLRRSAARQRELFAQLDAEWLGAALDPVLAEAEAVGKALGATGGLAREIERKYLLRELPAALRQAASLEVRQGWLPGTVLRERLRRVAGDGVVRYYRTVKAGAGLERLEIEEETTPELFDHLWPLTEGRRVVKQRYRRRDRGLTWEVDVFTDRDLVLAEVELPTTATPVELPRWLRESVVREVTGEASYYNVTLAR